MRSICIAFIILLVLMTSSQCQLTSTDWFDKGDTLTGQGKYEEAVQAYDMAIQLKPNYDSAWYNKAVALKALGRTNESNAAFAKSRELANLFFASSVSVPSQSIGHIITGSAAQNLSQYAQYYTTPIVSAPSIHISSPVQTLILGKTPTIVYLGTSQQSMPYSQFKANANNAIVPSLWIQEAGSWTQYLEVPQGATATLIAVSPSGASGTFNEIFNGAAYNFSFYFYPNSVLTFYADTIGRHTLSVDVNGQTSNQVTIDVIAYVPPQYCLTPSYYWQSYYYPGFHYPNHEFGRHWTQFLGGHNWYGSDYPWLNAP